MHMYSATCVSVCASIHVWARQLRASTADALLFHHCTVAVLRPQNSFILFAIVFELTNTHAARPQYSDEIKVHPQYLP